jgi:hypothetical protein
MNWTTENGLGGKCKLLYLKPANIPDGLCWDGLTDWDVHCASDMP